MKQVLITGGSGLIGSKLARMLEERAYGVRLLSRKPKTNSPYPVFRWDPEKGEMDVKALDQVDFIIHLAGLNIGEGRWTSERKRQIVASRVESGELLLRTLKAQQIKPRAFISASAIGYYGGGSSELIFEENAPAGKDFLAQICQKWEAIADRFEETGIRAVKIRSGVVLAKQGGALSKMSLPVRLGVGAPLGSGMQYMPWIHMEDLCGIFIHALEQSELKGAYNAVAPEHVTNVEFTRKMAGALKKPLWLPRVPAGLIRLMFGEMSVMLLEGSRISAGKIVASGFTYRFPELDQALKSLLAR